MYLHKYFYVRPPTRSTVGNYVPTYLRSTSYSSQSFYSHSSSIIASCKYNINSPHADIKMGNNNKKNKRRGWYGPSIRERGGDNLMRSKVNDDDDAQRQMAHFNKTEPPVKKPKRKISMFSSLSSSLSSLSSSSLPLSSSSSPSSPSPSAAIAALPNSTTMESDTSTSNATDTSSTSIVIPVSADRPIRLTIGQEVDLLSFVSTHAALIQEMLQDRLPDLDVLDILQRMIREGHNLEYILSQLKLACDNCELADEMCVQIESFIFQLRSNHLSPSLSSLAATATLPTPSNNSTAMESDTSTSNATVTSSASIVISASAEMDTTKTKPLSFLAQYEKAKVLHESISKSNDTTITLTSTCSQVERRLKKEDPRFKDSTLHIRSRTRSKKGKGKGKGKGKDKKGKRKSPPEEPPKFGLENKAPEPVKDDLLKACVQSAAVDADGNVDPKLLAQALDAGYSKYFVLGKVEEHLDSIKHTKPPAAKKTKIVDSSFSEAEVVTSRRGRATKKITYAEFDIEDSEDEAPKKNSRRGKKAAPKKAPAKGGKKKASRAYDSDSEEFELDLDSQDDDDDGDEDDDDESFKGDTEEDDSDDGVAAEGKRSKSNKDRNPKAKKRSKSGKSKSEPTKKIAWDEIDLNMDITASAENERLVNYRKAAEKIKKVSVVMNTM